MPCVCTSSISLQQIKLSNLKTQHRVPLPVGMNPPTSSPCTTSPSPPTEQQKTKAGMNLRKRKTGTKTKQNKTAVLWGQQQSPSCQWSDWRLGRLHLLSLREEWPQQAGPGEAVGWQSLGLVWGWNLIKRGLTGRTWRTSALDMWRGDGEEPDFYSVHYFCWPKEGEIHICLWSLRLVSTSGFV